VFLEELGCRGLQGFVDVGFPGPHLLVPLISVDVALCATGARLAHTDIPMGCTVFLGPRDGATE